MTATIRPVEIAGQFWVFIAVDGGELEPRGPFSDAAEAGAAAAQMGAVLRTLCSGGVHVGDTPAARRQRA